MILIQKDVVLKVGEEERKVDLYLNENGNLVLEGIGSVTYEMYDDEIIFNSIRSFSKIK
jgi:hypothetical protein